MQELFDLKIKSCLIELVTGIQELTNIKGNFNSNLIIVGITMVILILVIGYLNRKRLKSFMTKRNLVMSILILSCLLIEIISLIFEVFTILNFWIFAIIAFKKFYKIMYLEKLEKGFYAKYEKRNKEKSMIKRIGKKILNKIRAKGMVYYILITEVSVETLIYIVVVITLILGIANALKICVFGSIVIIVAPIVGGIVDAIPGSIIINVMLPIQRIIKCMNQPNQMCRNMAKV